MAKDLSFKVTQNEYFIKKAINRFTFLHIGLSSIIDGNATNLRGST